MKCYVCDTELIWGGDHDIEVEENENIEEEDYVYYENGSSQDTIVTNLSCPNCGAYHEVYWKGEHANGYIN